MALNAIEIKGSRIKEIFFLARLFWSTFEIENETLHASLRFIELERKVDRFSTINEIIVEAPETEDLLYAFGKLEHQEVKISFQLNDETYYFPSFLKDIFVFYDKLPVMSFEWPEIVYKEQTRQAERIQSFLPESLEPNQFYTKDISVKGLSFIYTGILDLALETQLQPLQISIPLLRKSADQLNTVYYQISTAVEVVRQIPIKDEWRVYGCQFMLYKPAHFCLIRQYLNIRLKEDAFFEKNQYYPKLVLPEIKLKMPQLPQ